MKSPALPSTFAATLLALGLCLAGHSVHAQEAGAAAPAAVP